MQPAHGVGVVLPPPPQAARCSHEKNGTILPFNPAAVRRCRVWHAMPSRAFFMAVKVQRRRSERPRW